MQKTPQVGRLLIALSKRLIGGFDFCHHGGIGEVAVFGECRGDAVRVAVVLHFHRLRVIRVVVMQGGGDGAHGGIMRQAVFEHAVKRLDKAFLCAEFAQRLAANAVHVVVQVGVGEAFEDFFDVGAVGRRVEVVAADEHGAAFFHHRFGCRADGAVLHRCADGGFARQFAEVSERGVAGVQGEEFALDESHEFVGRQHAGDGGQRTFELGAVHDPFAEDFDGNGKRVVAAAGDGRDDTVHGAIDKAGVGVDKGGILTCGGEDFFFEVAAAAHHVFAGDDVERRAACTVAGGEGLRELRRDDFQHGRADGGGHEIGCRDFSRHHGGVAGVDAAHVVDGLVFVHAVADDVDAVGVVAVQAVDDGGVDVGEGDFVTCIGKDFADEAAPDVAAAEV